MQSNPTELPGNFSDRLWAEIRKRRPKGHYGRFADVRFGEVLREESKFLQLMKELQL